MGADHSSVALGSYVLAYDLEGKTRNIGDQVYGNELLNSYVPGSFPYGLGKPKDYWLQETHLFECMGYSPGNTANTTLDVEVKSGTTTIWQRVA